MTPNIVDDFMCRHGDSEHDAQKVYDWAIEYLGCEPANIVSNVVYSLVARHNVGSIEVLADQWAMVRAENYDKSFSARVQCDDIEDGFARLLQLFVENDKHNEN